MVHESLIQIIGVHANTRTAIGRVLLSQSDQSFRKLVVIFSKHVNGAVNHFHQEACMHDETTASDELGWIGIDIQGESKEDLSFGTLLKETKRKKKRRRMGVSHVPGSRMDSFRREGCDVRHMTAF